MTVKKAIKILDWWMAHKGKVISFSESRTVLEKYKELKSSN